MKKVFNINKNKKKEVKNFLVKLIYNKKGNIEKYENKKFMNLNSVDSMSIFKIILKIEEKYKISLEDKFIFSNKFKTIKGIADLIIKKINTFK